MFREVGGRRLRASFQLNLAARCNLTGNHFVSYVCPETRMIEELEESFISVDAKPEPVGDCQSPGSVAVANRQNDVLVRRERIISQFRHTGSSIFFDAKKLGRRSHAVGAEIL